MLQTIADSWRVAAKDLKELVRDRVLIVTFLIMPIFMMIMVGYIFPSQNSLKNIPIGIANQDNGTIGQNLATIFKELKSENTRAFEIKEYKSTKAIKDGIRKQEISGGVVIPTNFSTNISTNKQAHVAVVQDQSNPQISALTTQALTKVIEAFSSKLGEQKISKLLVIQQQLQQLTRQKTTSDVKTGAKPSAVPFVTSIKTRYEVLVPGKQNYFEFVAPGIMAMVVLTAVLTGLAGAVAKEREQGTLDGILIAPIGRLSIISGKALAQSIRGLIQGGIVLLLSIAVFGVTVHGSFLLVALLLFLGIFSFVGLGVLVSASVAEQETATQMLFMFQFPMIFLSGAFFPIQQMPKAMQSISHLLPLTYAIEALRKIIILGADINAVRSEILILLMFGVVSLVISVPVFKRLVTR